MTTDTDNIANTWKSGFPNRIEDGDFRFVCDLMYRKTGIRLGDAKRILVTNRLRKRLSALGMSGFDEYFNSLRDEKTLRDELGGIINCITTNETYFFREAGHFDILRDVVFPAYSESGQPLNIWSAGCSTGQEVYSISICALEHMAATGRRLALNVLGTDISSEVIKIAKNGIYPDRLCRGLSPEQQRGYMEKIESGFSVDKKTRSQVSFRTMNLINDQLHMRFDVVFCRNVMIYFDRESQARVVENLRRHLRPDGMLFIGHAESLRGCDTDLSAERRAGSSFYRKKADTDFADFGGNFGTGMASGVGHRISVEDEL